MATPPDDHRLGRAYSAPEVTVFYDRGRCRHYAECVRGLPQVFDPTRRPWIRGDLVLDTPEGPLAETRAALCACGRTQNQPFCDGACGVNAGASGGTRDQAETSPRSVEPEIGAGGAGGPL
jgi:uncharacterized Fe-S cluster protein YjdI